MSNLELRAFLDNDARRGKGNYTIWDTVERAKTSPDHDVYTYFSNIVIQSMVNDKSVRIFPNENAEDDHGREVTPRQAERYLDL